MAHIGRHAVRGAFAATFLLLIMTSVHDARAAEADSRTLVMTLDRAAYPRDVDLLADQVKQAVMSQRMSLDMHTTKAGVAITVGNSEREKKFLEDVEHHFAGNPQFAIAKTKAPLFSISYSPEALKTYGKERLQNDFDSFEMLIKGLRPPLPGVSIESQDDGAIIRSHDPGFGDVLAKQLGVLFVVKPLTSSSWHVAMKWENAPKNWSPAKRLQVLRETATAVRYFLGDPLDLQVEPNDEGAEFTVSDPERHRAFIEAVRSTFAHNPDFVMTETPAVILNITKTDLVKRETANSGLGDSSGVDNPQFDLLDEVDELANPPVEIAVAGNAVSVRARDPVHDADRAAIVRTALATRTDIVIAAQPDQSLLISLVPGTHLLPPRPVVDSAQLAKAVETRIDAMKLRSTHVVAAGTERVHVRFASEADATLFRNALSHPAGLSIRLVDERPSNDTSNAAPPPGDERLPMAEGGVIWVKPGLILSGDMIADAKVGTNSQTGQTVISIRFTDAGRALFAAATEAHIGERFAVVIDGVVVTAPVIREPIMAGQGEIEGNFTPELAKAAAESILAHKDDLPLKIVEDGATQ